MRFPMPVFAPDAPTSPAPNAAADAGGSTPTSTPSDSPATPATPSPDLQTPSPSGGVDPSTFEFMFNSTEADPFEGQGLSPPATTQPEPKPAQPVPSAPVVKAAEPAKVEPATATPAPTETPSPAPGQPVPQANLDPYDPGTLAAHLAQNEEQVVQHVADGLFKLSDKDVEELESNAVVAIPKLLARAFVASQKNFLMQMAQIVPRMVQTHGEVTKRHTEAEGEFYTRWPDLKKDQHGTLVMQYAAVYRQMHPEASRKDMIEAVGPMAMMAAKVQPSIAPQGQPLVNGGVRPPQPAPFVPAGPSAGGASMSTAPQLTPVEAMFAGQEE